MDKRIPYTIIPNFFNSIYEREPIAKIKVIYWKLKCDDNPALSGCEINQIIYSFLKDNFPIKFRKSKLFLISTAYRGYESK